MDGNSCYICDKKSSRLIDISKKKANHTRKDISEVLGKIFFKIYQFHYY